MQIMTAAWIKIGSKDGAPYPGKKWEIVFEWALT
jgi:hypothetical protein